MSVSIELDDSDWAAVPDLSALSESAVHAALFAAGWDSKPLEIALLFTNDEAITELNAEWRGMNKPTNVLSFPASPGMPFPAGEPRPLGDIVLAFGVIAREAEEQGKSLRAHTVHLIVHGVLHLLGHDHEDDSQAEAMEGLEIAILKGLGISNPYERQ